MGKIRCVYLNRKSSFALALCLVIAASVLLLMRQRHANNIFEACRDGKLSAVRVFVQRDPASVNVTDEYGEYPLAYAAASGDERLVRYLVSQGANIDKSRALIAAAMWGKCAVVKLLLEKGASVNVTNSNGFTALWEAAHWSRGDARQIVRLLIEAGAAVDCAGYQGYSISHCLAGNGDDENLKLLLAKGAEINARSGAGQTPLHCAASGGHLRTVQILLADGADLCVVDKQGATPLQLAEENGHGEVTEYLRREMQVHEILPHSKSVPDGSEPNAPRM